MQQLTPVGVFDLTPDDTARYDAILKKAASVFNLAGYKQVRTATIEYQDALAPGLSSELKQDAIRFFDENGHTLMLRPDNTLAIARLVSTQMTDEPLPMKLFYQTPVFRRASSSEDIQQFQTGMELIGDESIDADISVLQLVFDICHKLGLKDVRVDIGHVDFVSSISPVKQRALLDGNYVKFGSLPERGTDNVVKDHPDLKALWKGLKKTNMASSISFNKGLIKKLSYYTGIIFEAYIPGCGHPIVSGGRYNSLLTKFGVNEPAVGFAVNLNEVWGLK